MKKLLSLLVCLSFALPLVAGDTIRVPDNKRISKDDPPPKKTEILNDTPGVDFPSVWSWKQFVARTNANYQYNGRKSIGDEWWFQTVQPFYVSKNTLSNSLFLQFRAMFQSTKKTFNTGLGYRYLMANQKYLFGINGFYDARRRHQLQRWSIGGDFHTQWLSIWGNFYDNIVRWRYIGTTGTSGTDLLHRRVLGGGDVGMSAPFPYMPWLRIEAGFYQWNYKDAKNAPGYTIAGRAQIWGPLFIEGGRTSDRYLSNNFVHVSLNIGFPNFMEYTLVNTPISKTILPARKLKRFVLDPIRRYNRFRIQQRTTTAGGIIIGRT